MRVLAAGLVIPADSEVRLRSALARGRAVLRVCMSIASARRGCAALKNCFPDSLEFVSRSMRAGHAFSVSLEMIHREFQEPLAGEFRRTFEEHNLGLPLEVALQKLAKRVPSLDVHFFVSAVLLQKRTGGNLAEILDKLAYVIRERFKLRGRIRAISAHGSMTGTALSLIPVGGRGSDVLHQSGLRQILLHGRCRQHHAGRGRVPAVDRLRDHAEDREDRGLMPWHLLLHSWFFS